MGKRQKRKIINYSIKRKMQIRLFMKILSNSLMGIALMAAAFYFFSNREISSSFRQFHIQANNFLDLLLPTVLSSVGLALVGAIAITLFLPVKIAGPLFRIERDLKEKVAKGNLSVRVNLRKGDEMGDLAEALNTCLESLGQKINSIKISTDLLESAITGTEGIDVKNCKDHVLKIRESLNEFMV